MRSGMGAFPGIDPNRSRFFILIGAMLIGIIGLSHPKLCEGDELLLRNNNSLRGKLISKEPIEDGVFAYLFETDQGVILRLTDGPGGAVRRERLDSEQRVEYLKLVESSGDSIEEHWAMAEFCRENRLRSEREQHLWAIVRLDSDHVDARRALGFFDRDGRWLTQDQLMHGQGYVKEGGQWMLPAEVVLKESRDQRESEIIDWRRQVSIWDDWLGGRKEAEALNGIRNLGPEDVAAIPVVSEKALAATDFASKRLWIETLERIGGAGTRSPLQQIALNDTDPDIRDLCVQILVRQDPRAASTFFLAHLDPANNSPLTISRAGYALEQLGDEGAVRSLIRAVVTEHKQMVGGNSGGGMGINFNSSGQFQVNGDKPREVTTQSQNPGVLAALNQITGQNFGYNRDAWQRWFIEQNSHPDVDLRRAID